MSRLTVTKLTQLDTSYKEVLSVAARAVEMLTEFAENMRTEEEFARVVVAASKAWGFCFPVLGPKERNPGQQRYNIV